MTHDDWILLLLSISVLLHALWLGNHDHRIWKLERKRRLWTDDEND